jgi:hypothetical protein
MRRRHWSPQPAKQTRDDDILLGLRRRAERCPRLAPLKKHRTAIIVGFEKPHGWIAVPEPQALDLVLAFHMRHAKLQHGRRPGSHYDGRDPRATHLVAVERTPERERPSVFQVTKRIGKSREPCCALGDVAARRRQSAWNGERHSPIL